MTLSDVLQLPSLDVAKARQLPIVRALYFVLTDNRILYVGQSENLNRRWRNHHRRGELKAVGSPVSIYWQRVDAESDIVKAEAELIEALQPEMNATAVVGHENLLQLAIPLTRSIRTKCKIKAASTDSSITTAVREFLERWATDDEQAA